MIDFMQNEKNDNLYTPFESVYPLLDHIHTSKTHPVVWECTDYGQSRITLVLESLGYTVIKTDIIHGFDFLKETANFHFDMIITNPPYSLKDEFIAKCYEYGKPFGLLLPLTFLEGVWRGAQFKKFGVSTIILDRRADFSGGGTNWFNTSWMISNMPEGNGRLFFEELGIADKYKELYETKFKSLDIETKKMLHDYRMKIKIDKEAEKARNALAEIEAQSAAALQAERDLIELNELRQLVQKTS